MSEATGVMVVGAEGHSAPEAAEGNAFVYYGHAAGIPDAPDLVLDNPANLRNGCFGRSAVGAGDLNGDGYADLIVGATGQGNPEGREGNVFIYRGAEGGISATPSVAKIPRYSSLPFVNLRRPGEP